MCPDLTRHQRFIATAACLAFAIFAATATGTTGARRLAVTKTLENQLVAAFAPAHHTTVAEVGGTDPGSVLYAFDPATRAYWAEAFFFPSTKDSDTVKNTFQDAGSNGIFSRSAGGAWKFLGAGMPISCTEQHLVPKAVLAVWHKPARSPGCGAATG